MKAADSYTILGIDPGTTVMGYGVLSYTGNKATLVDLGCVQFKDCHTHYEKLQKVFDIMSNLIERYQPNEMAIEAPFYGKNVQSMLKLGRAQGVAIAAAMRSGLTVDEYSPLKVKMAITGNGASSKEQVADMLRRFLHIPLDDLNLKLDATDALAVAYCHFLQKKNPVSDKPYKNWKDFLAKNGDRIKK